MERLTRMYCDGCGRKPTFMEWFRGELGAQGYQDWHHPGIAFKAAGLPVSYENQRKVGRIFLALFNRPFPEEPHFLCPICHEHAMERLPELVALDPGDTQPSGPEPGAVYLGREPLE